MSSLKRKLQFPKSTSPQFSMALAIAECSYKFSSAGEGRNALYIAIFDNNIEQLKAFQKLFQIVCSWKGVSIEINSMPVKPWEISKTLEYFMQSLLCLDYRAYCWLFGVDAKEEGRRLALSVSMTDTLDEILRATKRHWREMIPWCGSRSGIRKWSLRISQRLIFHYHRVSIFIRLISGVSSVVP